jgi:hypothetical protein
MYAAAYVEASSFEPVRRTREAAVGERDYALGGDGAAGGNHWRTSNIMYILCIIFLFVIPLSTSSQL